MLVCLLVVGLAVPVAAAVLDVRRGAASDRMTPVTAVDRREPPQVSATSWRPGVRLGPGPSRAGHLLGESGVRAREALRQQRLERRARREARRERQQERQERRERRLARKAERQQQEEEPAVPSGAPFTVRIGSFNVLGSQHTDADGPRHKYAPASVRTGQAAGFVAEHGVDILGTQELQADQLRGLQSRTGMAAYPGFAWGEAETDNSILYDAGVFEFVSGDRFTITFMGRPRPQPIVRLRHRATGSEFYVVNTHPSAGGGAYLSQRRAGQAALVDVVNRLQTTGLPVLVTGDMNDREEFYCRVVPPAGLTASNGGSYGSGCQPPPQPIPVDWVVGSGATWTNYWRDTRPVERRVSDHFFISATAHIG